MTLSRLRFGFCFAFLSFVSGMVLALPATAEPTEEEIANSNKPVLAEQNIINLYNKALELSAKYEKLVDEGKATIEDLTAWQEAEAAWKAAQAEEAAKQAVYKAQAIKAKTASTGASATSASTSGVCNPDSSSTPCVSQPCSQIGATKMDKDQQNIIACLKDGTGGLFWKSTTGGGKKPKVSFYIASVTAYTPMVLGEHDFCAISTSAYSTAQHAPSMVSACAVKASGRNWELTPHQLPCEAVCFDYEP